MLWMPSRRIAPTENMRDSYVADVGDFGKYALLNALVGTDLRLGVLWYRNTLEDTSSDGRFTKYDELKACDPSLHDRLSKILDGNQRTVVEVEKGGILPGTTLFYSEAVPPPQTPCLSPARREGQAQLRKAWFGRGFERLSEAQLVFLDPDTGLAGSRLQMHSRRSVKYVFANEVTDWLRRGQSVVLYQHQQRKTLNDQVAEQRKMFGTGTTCLAVSFHRRSVRIYYILPARDHRVRLSERLSGFLAGAWGDHFSPV
jgi:hypothetical protein